MTPKRAIIRRLSACFAVALLAGCAGFEKDAERVSSRLPAGSRVISGGELMRTISEAALASGSAHVRLTTPPAGSGSPEGRTTIEGVIRYTDPAGMRYRIETAEPASVSQVILTEEAAYISGALTGVRGRPWIRIDAESLDQFGGALPLAAGDITGIGALGKSLSFTDSGSSTVPGTRQYTAQLSTQEWLAAQDESKREEMREWADREQASGLTVMVYLNEHNLPVQQILQLGQGYTLEAVFSDWGKPVSITPPPKRRTTRCETVAACEDIIGGSGTDDRGTTV